MEIKLLNGLKLNSESGEVIISDGFSKYKFLDKIVDILTMLHNQKGLDWKASQSVRKLFITLFTDK